MISEDLPLMECWDCTVDSWTRTYQFASKINLVTVGHTNCGHFRKKLMASSGGNLWPVSGLWPVSEEINGQFRTYASFGRN